MRYTAVFLNYTVDKYTTKHFFTHHDKNEAWKDISAQTPDGIQLLLIIPGEHVAHSEAVPSHIYNISLTNIA